MLPLDLVALLERGGFEFAGTQRVSMCDAEGLSVMVTRSATVNVWNSVMISEARGGVLASAPDAFTTASLPSAFWEGTTVLSLTALGSGNTAAPFTGAVTTVRTISAGVENAYRLLSNQSAADTTTAPRLAVQVKQPGADAWSRWQELGAPQQSGTVTVFGDANTSGTFAHNKPAWARTLSIVVVGSSGQRDRRSRGRAGNSTNGNAGNAGRPSNFGNHAWISGVPGGGVAGGTGAVTGGGSGVGASGGASSVTGNAAAGSATTTAAQAAVSRLPTC